jgi:hypothetical protein
VLVVAEVGVMFMYKDSECWRAWDGNMPACLKSGADVTALD